MSGFHSITNFYVLHRTALKRYERSVVHSYIDRYPRKYYESGNETPDIELDLTFFHGENCRPKR